MVVSNIFNFHPYLGKTLILTIFFRWVVQPPTSNILRIFDVLNNFDVWKLVSKHYEPQNCTMLPLILGAMVRPAARWETWSAIVWVGMTNKIIQRPGMLLIHVDVSKKMFFSSQNGWWKSWKTLLKWMIWGTHPYFWKHPMCFKRGCGSLEKCCEKCWKFGSLVKGQGDS